MHVASQRQKLDHRDAGYMGFSVEYRLGDFSHAWIMILAKAFMAILRRLLSCITASPRATAAVGSLLRDMSIV